jgi:hypothetical protein
MNFFGEIKKGALYFSNTELTGLLTEIEGRLTGQTGDVLRQLFERFTLTGEEHIFLMGKAIQTNKPYFFTG